MNQIRTLFFFLILTVQLPVSAQVVNSIHLSECDTDTKSEYLHYIRLISKQFSGDTLFLKLGIVQNCDMDPTIDIRENADSLILTIGNNSENFAACNCCFELSVTITGITNQECLLYYPFEFVDKYDNPTRKTHKRIYPYTNKYIVPSPAEIASYEGSGMLDENGNKLGLWETTYEGSKTVQSKTFYVPAENGKTRKLWAIHYDESGKIITAHAYLETDIEGQLNDYIIDGETYESLF